ncbi:tRNA lysidine(34) synthetase TilS [Pseudomonas sp. Marseille-QA0892]
MSPKRSFCSRADLESHLLECLSPWRDAHRVVVALSGGLDSMLLLHLLAGLHTRGLVPPVHAHHVHHGLQAAADVWAQHCQRQCDSLGIPLQVSRVRVPVGASLEAMAREARYRALGDGLATGDVLVFGHHRDDQIETFMFRLFRGAGVRGLAGMPGSRALGQGCLVRPLLDVARNQLACVAGEMELEWVDDPSNRDIALARNYLRSEVLPVIKRQWPRAGDSIARAARHLGEAQALLEELADDDLVGANKPSTWPWLAIPSLDFQALVQLSPARQRNVLRRWLQPFGEQPETEHWHGWRALRDAQTGASPIWRLRHGLLQRSAGRVWWLADRWANFDVPAAAQTWADLSRPLDLAGNGTLTHSGHGLTGIITVGYRAGGERISIPGRGHRDLKRLLNESIVPTFVRGRLPLIFQNGVLVAVANLPGLSSFEAQGARFDWSPPTNDMGLS